MLILKNVADPIGMFLKLPEQDVSSENVFTQFEKLLQFQYINISISITFTIGN